MDMRLALYFSVRPEQVIYRIAPHYGYFTVVCLKDPQFNLEGFDYKLIFLSNFIAKYWIVIIRNKGGNIFPILAA